MWRVQVRGGCENSFQGFKSQSRLSWVMVVAVPNYYDATWGCPRTPSFQFFIGKNSRLLRFAALVATTGELTREVRLTAYSAGCLGWRLAPQTFTAKPSTRLA